MPVRRLRPEEVPVPTGAPDPVAGLATITPLDPNADTQTPWASPVYARGALANRAVLFTVAGVPTDPTTVTATLYTPGVPSVVYVYPATILKLSVGAYELQVDTTPTTGEWVLHWAGTGATTCQAAVDDVFIVTAAR